MEGDLIYCLRGTIGKIARVPPGLPGAIASSLVILRAEDEFLNGFVYLRILLFEECQRPIGSDCAEQRVGTAEPLCKASLAPDFESAT